MASDIWSDLVLRPTIEPLGTLDTDDDAPVWELFHENSKTSRYERGLPPQQVARRMQDMWASLLYDQYPEVELPHTRAPLPISLEEALLTRTSARSLAPVRISLAKVATILHSAYGVTRDNEGTLYPRPFRTVPSAGALYPLEIYFYSSSIEELPAGLYHYNPARGSLRRLREGDLSAEIAAALVDPEMAYNASVIVFITAVFERATFKYGERGYRFTLLEAGHVAQNVSLAVNGLGLGSLNIGGFFDRELDELLGLDGVTQSTVYLASIGQQLTDAPHTVQLG
jgi:SagB-type dehydrogenase family enzyme